MSHSSHGSHHSGSDHHSHHGSKKTKHTHAQPVHASAVAYTSTIAIDLESEYRVLQKFITNQKLQMKEPNSFELNLSVVKILMELLMEGTPGQLNEGYTMPLCHSLWAHMCPADRDVTSQKWGEMMNIYKKGVQVEHKSTSRMFTQSFFCSTSLFISHCVMVQKKTNNSTEKKTPRMFIEVRVCVGHSFHRRTEEKCSP